MNSDILTLNKHKSTPDFKAHCFNPHVAAASSWYSFRWLHLPRPPATRESGSTVLHSTGLRATRHNCTQRGRVRGPTEQPVTLNHNSTHRTLESTEIESFPPPFPCFDVFIPCYGKISGHHWQININSHVTKQSKWHLTWNCCLVDYKEPNGLISHRRDWPLLF